MAIQDKITEKELLQKWESFCNLRDNYNNAISMLKSSINALKDNKLYETNASVEERAIVDEYAAKVKQNAKQTKRG